MNAKNYDKLMTDEISLNGRGKRLLLHCCCAPCSTACLERLKDDMSVTVFFYNPNIEDAEYNKRKRELVRLLEETGWADIVDCDRDTDKFYGAVKGLEKEPEGGRRCEICIRLRLSATAERARADGYDYFATTLTVSPLKNARLINSIGEEFQSDGCKWLYSDFKKQNGYLKSVRLSEKYGLYRQNYCGCVYSVKTLEN